MGITKASGRMVDCAEFLAISVTVEYQLILVDEVDEVEDPGPRSADAFLWSFKWSWSSERATLWPHVTQGGLFSRACSV